MAWDGEFVRVRGDLEEGDAGHHVREGAEMAMIILAPSLDKLVINEIINLSRHRIYLRYKYHPETIVSGW